MDTRWKKFKYSFFNKFLCIILCVVTAVGASFIITVQAIVLMDKAEYGEIVDSVFESNNIYYRISSGYRCAVNSALVDLYDYNSKLKALKKKACDTIYKKISDDNFGGSDTLSFSESYSYTPDLENYPDGEYVFTYYYSYDYAIGDDGNIVAEESNKKLEGDKLYADIEQEYISYVNDSSSDYSDAMTNSDDTQYINGFYYIIEAEEDDAWSNTDLTVDEIKTQKYYFAIKDGKVEKCADSELAKAFEKIISQSVRGKTEKYTLYGYIDFDGNNPFHLEQERLQKEKAIDDMGNLPYILAGVLVVASFAIGFYYLKLTGRKNGEESAKLSFIDYIPLEIHLGIVGGIGFGAAVLSLGYIEEVYDLSLICVIFALFVLVCWGLLFAFCSSVSRYIGSGKKFYKHLLIYWLCYGLFIILRLAFKGIRKANKKIAENIKLFKYKPKTFVRNVILMAAAYFILNIILFALAVFGFVDTAGLLAVAIVILLCLNGFVITAVCRYVKNLDEIIDAGTRRTDYGGEIEKLPNSLRALAESMKYTNAERQQAIAKAVKDERLRAELITNVSHDLKTPLTSIITYVDLLDKCDIDDENAVKYIKVLEEKGAKLKRLIDDLIEASKITSGSVSVNLMPMNLSELCLQSTVDMQNDFAKANLELIVKQGEKPVTVIADGSKAFRVIENLLSNARKYSAPHSRVYVSVYKQDSNGVFEIKNISSQPLDITPDELTERFVRGDKSRSEEGNGLGLSIAKELCKVQNGNLSISIDGDLFKAKASFPLESQG